jgi:hypothetical protein
MRASASENFSQVAVTLRPNESRILDESSFIQMISFERRRTERSLKPFLLMRLEMDRNSSTRIQAVSLRKSLVALSDVLRETDVIGWYKEESVIGAMLTEINLSDRTSVLASIMSRITEALKRSLTPQQLHLVDISFHFLPESKMEEFPARIPHPAMYSEISAVSVSSVPSI